MIFLIHDYFMKEFIAPNGFNMAMSEFDSHRLRIAGNSNHDFRPADLLNIDKANTIPISIQSYITNPEFFDSQGTVYYIIALNKAVENYPFLFNNGINNWVQYLNPQILDYVKQGKIKLVLQILIEPVTVVQYIIILRLTELGLGSLNNFEIWTTSGIPEYKEHDPLELDQSIRKVSDPFPVGDILHHHIKDLPHFENEVLRICTETEAVYAKDKEYISLCRRYTRERLITHSFILSNNLLDKGFNSIPSVSVYEDNNSLLDALTELKIDSSNVFSEPVNYAVEYYRSNDQGHVLDAEPVHTWDETMYKSTSYGFPVDADLERYYRRSYLSLIQEGEMTEDCFFITEKTYRAILYKHIFLVIGSPGLLVALRDKGYKTFDSLWSESYDLIKDPDERTAAVLTLFAELVNSNRLAELYERARPILEHNYEVLHKRANMRFP